MTQQVSMWEEQTLPTVEAITKNDLIEMMQGHVPGIRVPGVLTREQCALTAKRIRKAARVGARQYKGGLNIGTPLNIPSHWEFRYVQQSENAWFDYFKKVSVTTKRRHRLFEGIGDPLERIVCALGAAWGTPVRRVRHPKFGWRLYAGLIRSGAPALHFDWAPFDLGLSEMVLQAGANIYLSNFRRGGDLKVYRKYGMRPGNTVDSGAAVVGNYDMPHSLVEDVESRTIRCGVGDFVIAPNRFLHEVTRGDEPENRRLVLSFHIGLMCDGTLAVFS